MYKKIGFIIGTLAFVALAWYLFVKPSDYIVNFKVKTTPGTVIQSIKSWSSNLPASEIKESFGSSALVQERQFGDSTVTYTFHTYTLNDSITKVSVGVKDAEHSIKNRLTVPFTNTLFRERSTANVMEFYETLNQHLKEIKIEITGIEKTPSTYCAYIPLKSTQEAKALGMMRNYGYIGDVLTRNNVEMNGPPFVEITQWNQETDSISYNFCFPIIRSENLPMTEDIKYKRLFPKEAIHAVYNGNYITSDRAWYALLAYAKRNDLEVEQKPLEVFFNNPNIGSNVISVIGKIMGLIIAIIGTTMIIQGIKLSFDFLK